MKPELITGIFSGIIRNDCKLEDGSFTDDAVGFSAAKCLSATADGGVLLSGRPPQGEEK